LGSTLKTHIFIILAMLSLLGSNTLANVGAFPAIGHQMTMLDSADCSMLFESTTEQCQTEKITQIKACTDCDTSGCSHSSGCLPAQNAVSSAGHSVEVQSIDFITHPEPVFKFKFPPKNHFLS